MRPCESDYLRRVAHGAEQCDKLIEIVKIGRVDEVEKGPKLSDIILYRSAGQQNSMLRDEVVHTTKDLRM